MGACGSKPKVRGDGEDAPARPCAPASSTNLDRSGRDPLAGCSLAEKVMSPSMIPVETPSPAPTTARVKENVETISKADEKEKAGDKDSLKNNDDQLESAKQKSTPIEKSQDLELETMKPEPVKTHTESTKPEPVKTHNESPKPQIPKPELPSKENEIKLIDSEIKLLESAAKTLSKKGEQDRTPDETETKILASLATPENESESKAMPEKSEKTSISEESTWNGMSCASSRQASIDFLDASDKMVIDKGVLESMPVLSEPMKEELEKAMEEPITSTKSVKDWNAKMEKLESFGEAKKEKKSIIESEKSEDNVENDKSEKEKEKENIVDNANESPIQIGVNIRYPK